MGNYKVNENARIDQRYINIIHKLNENSKMRIRLNDTEEIDIKKDVRQDDIISPKLFTLVLEDVFKYLHWEDK